MNDKLRLQVLERDNYKCQNPGCNRPNTLHVHHITSRKKGGTDSLDNLITYCNSCHKTIEWWQERPKMKCDFCSSEETCLFGCRCGYSWMCDKCSDEHECMLGEICYLSPSYLGQKIRNISVLVGG